MRRVSDHDIDYPARLAAVVAAFQSGGTAAALEALQPIAYHPEPVTRRRSIPPAREVEVFRRDAWTCRYCGQPTVFLPVMAFLGHLFPDQFPYDPHWRAGVTHPAVSACGASVDHVVPVTRGGTDDLDNLVAACWPCNARKGDFTRRRRRTGTGCPPTSPRSGRPPVSRPQCDPGCPPSPSTPASYSPSASERQVRAAPRLARLSNRSLRDPHLRAGGGDHPCTPPAERPRPRGLVGQQ